MNYFVKKKNAKEQLDNILRYVKYYPNSTEQEVTEEFENGTGLSEEFQLDIVYGTAYSIKKYYMESGNPRQMRGASQNLNKIFNKHIPLYLEKKYKKECIYYQGGSQILIIMPSGCGSEIASYIEDCFEKYAPTANNVAVTISCSANDLLCNSKYIEVRKKISDLCMERRMLKFDSNLIDIRNGFVLDVSKHKYLNQYSGQEMRCERCRLRIPQYIANIENDSFLLCPSCARKEMEGDYLARNYFRDACKSYGEEHLPDIILNVDENIRTTDDLQDENGDIALLYADVNNLGGMGLRIQGICDERVFFEAVDETVKDALYYSIILAMKCFDALKYGEENVEKEVEGRFEIIAVGGDDICLILPAQIALSCATMLVRKFEEVWEKNYQSGFERELGGSVHLSISAGISIASYNTPLTYMQDATEQLLKSAKQLSHAKKDKKMHGAIDILSLNSDGQWAAELDFLRNYKDERNPLFKPGVRMTLRPFAVEEAEVFLEVLELARKLPMHLLRNIDSACKEMTREEASLYFDYVMSKIRNNRSSQNKYELIKKQCALVRKMKGEKPEKPEKAPAMFIKSENEEYVTPWHDILDLYDQRGGGLR